MDFQSAIGALLGFGNARDNTRRVAGSYADPSNTVTISAAPVMKSRIPPKNGGGYTGEAAPQVNPWIEGIQTFLGFRPDNGFQDNGVQGFANSMRALLGVGPAAAEDTARVKSLSDNDLARSKYDAARYTPQDAKTDPVSRLDGVSGILDPDYAGKRADNAKSAYDFDRKQRYAAAIAAGDYATAAKIDPKGTIDIQNAIDDRKASTTATSQGNQLRILDALRNTPAGKKDFAAAVQAVAQANPGLLDQQTVDLATQGGYDAASRFLGAKAPGISKIVTADGGAQKAVMDDTSVVDLGFTSDSMDRQLTMAQIAAARALAAQRNANTDGSGATGGFADPQFIQSNLNRLDKAISDGEKNGAFMSAGQNPASRFMSSTGGALANVPGFKQIQDALAPAQQLVRQEIDATTKSLMQSIRTLPGMDASRLADTENEVKRIMGIIDDPQYSVSVKREQLNNLKMLFAKTLGGYTASAPSASGASTEVPSTYGQVGPVIRYDANGNRIK